MIIKDQGSINDTFRSYFTCLYKSEFKAKQHDFDNFFNNLSLPKLRDEDKENLEAPIS